MSAIAGGHGADTVECLPMTDAVEKGFVSIVVSLDPAF
jgi:hypothetical protein